MHVKPTIGKRPAFLDEGENALQLHTSAKARRALDALKNHKSYWSGALDEYLQALADGIETMRIPYKGGYENLVMDSIVAFLPYRDEFIQVCGYCAENDEYAIKIHNFFEVCSQSLERKSNTGMSRDCETDNTRFVIYELFMHSVSIMLQKERFAATRHLLQSDYLTKNANTNFKNEMKPFAIFGNNEFEMFEILNKKLPSPYNSYRAHLLLARVAEKDPAYDGILQADLICFLAANARENNILSWWPDTLVYARKMGVAQVFARSQSREYFSRFESVIGMSAERVGQIATEIDSGSTYFSHLFQLTSMRILVNLKNLCQRP